MRELTGDRNGDQKPVSDDPYSQAVYGFVYPCLLYLYAASSTTLSSHTTSYRLAPPRAYKIAVKDRAMSALGQKQTCAVQLATSAMGHKTDIPPLIERAVQAALSGRGPLRF